MILHFASTIGIVNNESVFIIFFFFSSRRRHTRYWRDWSSDVCSSDLAMGSGISYGMRYLLRMIFNLAIDQDDDGNAAGGRGKTAPAAEERRVRTVVPEIGRASCRERV